MVSGDPVRPKGRLVLSFSLWPVHLPPSSLLRFPSDPPCDLDSVSMSPNLLGSVTRLLQVSGMDVDHRPAHLEPASGYSRDERRAIVYITIMAMSGKKTTIVDREHAPEMDRWRPKFGFLLWRAWIFTCPVGILILLDTVGHTLLHALLPKLQAIVLAYSCPMCGRLCKMNPAKSGHRPRITTQ